MRRLFLALMTFLYLFVSHAVLAADEGLLGEEFDARLLSYQEKRVLQAALVLSGDYDGMLDGAWGQGSQRALESLVLRVEQTRKPLFSDVAQLLVAFERERARAGWSMSYSQTVDISYALPWQLLKLKADGDNVFMMSDDQGLTFRLAFSDLPTLRGWHEEILAVAAPGTKPYRNESKSTLVSIAESGSGLIAYMRSDHVGRSFVTRQITATSAYFKAQSLMVASTQRGQTAELTLPTDGMLYLMTKLVGRSSRAVETPGLAAAPAARPAAPAAKRKADGSGTGFFVNNTDIVTAAHVIEGCRTLTLQDGTPLSPLHKDVVLDLAVLTSPGRSDHWLLLSTEVDARLGEQVVAVGYPYLGTLSQGLTVTGGNVSALQDINGGQDRIMISAPVQPGNSGGPLLNAGGAVIGVVVSRVNDLTILKETGTLPQNMNFAVRNRTLTEFLGRAQVMFPQEAGAGTPISAGLPEAMTQAVVAIYCGR